KLDPDVLCLLRGSLGQIRSWERARGRHSSQNDQGPTCNGYRCGDGLCARDGLDNGHWSIRLAYHIACHTNSPARLLAGCFWSTDSGLGSACLPPDRFAARKSCSTAVSERFNRRGTREPLESVGYGSALITVGWLMLGLSLLAVLAAMHQLNGVLA